MEIKLISYNKKIKEDYVLKDINYTFKQGNIYGLIGKNGSGKTMLLKAMSGFLRPSNGKVIVNDQELYLKEEFPKDMGVMIGNCEYIKDMTGKDNLKYLASLLKKIDDDRINEVIDIVNLTDEKDKLVKKYSLGMKQKLGIAQAIMEYPKILLLDEPFNGIDNESVSKIKKYLYSIKKDTIIIIATHYKEDIDNFCDIIIKLENGTIINN
ncbi:MAG: ABC transporter ATP-binding protein [Tenericutes bacterium]|nr:ABC transporter ATP-binding protein [Mycoplasmatota bacterium]MDD6388650.1 ABC transporter ATP-binding protein [Bacilli bacterium]